MKTIKKTKKSVQVTPTITINTNAADLGLSDPELVKEAVEIADTETKLPTEEDLKPSSPLPEELAEVQIKLGETINLGSFSSLRVDVGISVPCLASQVDKAFDAARIWTTERLKTVTEGLTQEFKNKTQVKEMQGDFGPDKAANAFYKTHKHPF